MPEFIATKSLPPSLDAFTRAYLEAAEWTDCHSDAEEDQPGITDAPWAAAAIEKARLDCAAFQESMRTLLDETGASDSRHGVDFWLTRNHHGAGFWDRGYDARISDALTDCAHGFGEVYVYLGNDGAVYFG